eukprot:TRINITY_DN86_c0_g2_i1.p1 TRINITY_DN86_c0_g2~~TRINITY_DN86_c0_g2_i1.p1  ORF type:complete len:216 (-),score=66.32 TRINITY_DN86_c0_g2_i1:35-682(-)
MATPEDLRAEANKHGDLRSKYMEQSKEAYAKGDKKEAKELSDKGKEEGTRMEQAHERAAKAFFERNNPNPTDLTVIDLHGLQVKEAVQYTTSRLDNCAKKKIATLTIIVGAGNHSEGGAQGRKIKPAIEEILAQRKLKFTDNQPNHGCMLVEFNGDHSSSSSSSTTHSNTNTLQSHNRNNEHEQTLVIEPIRKQDNQDNNNKKEKEKKSSSCTIL